MAKDKAQVQDALDRREALARDIFLVLVGNQTGRQPDHLAQEAFGKAEAFLRVAEQKREAK